MKKLVLLLLVIVCSGFLKLSAQQDCITSKPHHIDYAGACSLITAYINKADATNHRYYTKGGYFEIPKSKLHPAGPMALAHHCGLAVWFFKKNNKFYGAYDVIDIYDGELPRNKIVKAKYYDVSCVNYVFNNTIEQTRNLTTELIKEPNPNHDYAVACTEDPILGSTLLDANQSFIDDYPGITDAVGFIHSDNIDSLLSQDNCTGLRVYWGYDSARGYIKYPIRMVVFGINNKGGNIFNGDPRDDKDFILEQSWPPKVQ